jgi:hypothetical protein
MALVFARALCNPEQKYVKLVSLAPDLKRLDKDALALYDERFKRIGMSNSTSGQDTLRHAYVLLIGLGMMESSGKYCEGRDVSMCYNNPDSAEAGLFQTSYGVRRASPVLEELIAHYKADQSGCMVDHFKGNFACSFRRSRNAKCPNATSDTVGTGPGADWQNLTKSCPAFAAEYASVVLRTSGGSKGEFGPIKNHSTEVASECDALLMKVQKYVVDHPSACEALKW